MHALIDRAASYGLTSQQQACRFINLAAAYGWDFDSNPDLLWMRKILTDTSPGRPGERLDRLVQTCLHRQSIEEHNRVLRQQSGLTAASAAGDVPGQAHDGAADGPPFDSHVQVASSEALLVSNPLSHHLSTSLGQSAETASSSPAAPTPSWANNSPALFHPNTGTRDVIGN